MHWGLAAAAVAATFVAIGLTGGISEVVGMGFLLLLLVLISEIDARVVVLVMPWGRILFVDRVLSSPKRFTNSSIVISSSGRGMDWPTSKILLLLFELGGRLNGVLGLVMHLYEKLKQVREQQSLLRWHWKWSINCVIGILCFKFWNVGLSPTVFLKWWMVIGNSKR